MEFELLCSVRDCVQSNPLVQGVLGSNGARVASLQTISFEMVMVLLFPLLVQLFISGFYFLQLDNIHLYGSTRKVELLASS